MIVVFWIAAGVFVAYGCGVFIASIASQGTVTFDWPLALLDKLRKEPRRW